MPAPKLVLSPQTGDPVFDAESAEWVRVLTSDGPEKDGALTRLHGGLLRIARTELARRRHRLNISGPEVDDLAYQAAADALLAITGKILQFRGESRFTTWAYRFVIFEVSTKIGRHFWRRPSLPLDDEGWDRLPDKFGLTPAQESESRELIDALRHAVQEELTDHQREIFVAVVLNGVPLDALVVSRRTNRNAIYKTMFDARRKLRAALVAKGYLDMDQTKARC